MNLMNIRHQLLGIVLCLSRVCKDMTLRKHTDFVSLSDNFGSITSLSSTFSLLPHYDPCVSDFCHKGTVNTPHLPLLT